MRFSFEKVNHLRAAVFKGVLGTGGFATVKLFQCKENHNNTSECNKLFVIKELNVSFEYCWNKQDIIKKYEFLKKMLRHEYNIGLKLTHPNIIKTIDIDIERNYIMLEHITGIDMFDYLYKNCQEVVNSNDKEIACTYTFLLKKFYDVLSALEYMHDIGIAHRDIKLENILLDTVNNTVKLIDFGQSFEFKRDNSYIYSGDVCGTDGYFPPEYHNRSAYMPDKADVWSCGVVIYNLVYDCMPWECANPNTDDLFAKCYHYFVLNQLESSTFDSKNYKIRANENDIKILNDIFKCVFDLNPLKRITISELKDKLGQLSFLIHIG